MSWALEWPTGDFCGDTKAEAELLSLSGSCAADIDDTGSLL